MRLISGPALNLLTLSFLTILSVLTILSFAHCTTMFPGAKLWATLALLVSIAAFPLEERGSSVIIGYRTVSAVRRDFQYRGRIS
jgi:hypothetical protein